MELWQWCCLWMWLLLSAQLFPHFSLTTSLFWFLKLSCGSVLHALCHGAKASGSSAYFSTGVTHTYLSPIVSTCWDAAASCCHLVASASMPPGTCFWLCNAAETVSTYSTYTFEAAAAPVPVAHWCGMPVASALSMHKAEAAARG